MVHPGARVITASSSDDGLVVELDYEFVFLFL